MEYFYVLTLTGPTKKDVKTITTTGIVVQNGGTSVTRRKMFETVVRQIEQEENIQSGMAQVIFWSLEKKKRTLKIPRWGFLGKVARITGAIMRPLLRLEPP
jgi:hypothetical protein